MSGEECSLQPLLVMSVRKPNVAAIKKLLDQPESLKFETKRVSGKMVGKALETICAFANTSGGILVLGVEDAKKTKGNTRLCGISENPEAVAELERKLSTHFLPPIEGIESFDWSVRNRERRADTIKLLKVVASKHVHSILDNGTWRRIGPSNRQMNASEIAELSFARGARSIEGKPVDVDLDLLNTDAFSSYCAERGIRRGSIGERLLKIGLASRSDRKTKPTLAAVVLFAESPSDLLASQGHRSGIRIFHYAGSTIERGVNPNLRKKPITIGGPAALLIEQTTDRVLEEIASGFQMAKSGFTTVHTYPDRVIKEAITNAVLHRDYRYVRDAQIRIFDDRIEIESPGVFPANITPLNIHQAGSSPRNPSLVSHIREFPEPPNVDAGEGVPMMFQAMQDAGFYPPRYSWEPTKAVPTVTVTLLNECRPAIWEQVSFFIDQQGKIANKDLREIAGVETLEASRMLREWVKIGFLKMDDSKGKRNTVYRKDTGADDMTLFDEGEVN